MGALGACSQELRIGWHQEGLLRQVLLELRPEGLWEGVKADGGEGRSGESVLGWTGQVAQALGPEAHVTGLGVRFILRPCMGLWATGHVCWLQASEEQSRASPPTFHKAKTS